MRRSRLVLAALALALLGGGAAFAVGETTGTNVACATASTPDHVVAVDGTPVTTVAGDTQSNCVTQTYTIPTTTQTQTVTNTVTVTTGGTTSTSSSYPAGPLKYAPPGWNGQGSPSDPANYPGYTVVHAPQTGGTLTLPDNSKNYFIELGHPSWSSQSSGRSELEITGGNNRVIVGGEITVNSTNAVDDAASLLIDGGNPAGITHIEGVLFDSSVNAITLRTPQDVQIENVRIADNHVYEDDTTTGGVHPDLIQQWASSAADKVKIDYLTGYSDFTGLSILNPPNPTEVDVDHTDLHALAPQPNSVRAGWPLLGGYLAYFGDQKATTWKGTAYIDQGYYSSTGRRSLSQVLEYGETSGPAAFEVWRNGSVAFTSANPPSNGDATGNLGLVAGDTEKFSRVPLLSGMTFIEGSPPGGNFVPAGVAGTGYVSPGYQ